MHYWTPNITNVNQWGYGEANPDDTYNGLDFYGVEFVHENDKYYILNNRMDQQSGHASRLKWWLPIHHDWPTYDGHSNFVNTPNAGFFYEDIIEDVEFSIDRLHVGFQLNDYMFTGNISLGSYISTNTYTYNACIVQANPGYRGDGNPILPPNVNMGTTSCPNCNSGVEGSDVSISADGNNEAEIQLRWNGRGDYCNEIFDPTKGATIIVEKLSGNGTVLTTNALQWHSTTADGTNKYKPLPITVRGLGPYSFRIKIRDRWGNESYTNPISVLVLPSCYGEAAPNVTLTGTNMTVIKDGYGHPLGSYRLEKDQEYTLSLGSIEDFCDHYQVSLGDGITVVPSNETSPCLPTLAPRDPITNAIIPSSTGLQVSSHLPSSGGFKFIPRDQISSYKIDIQKRPDLTASEENSVQGSYCPSFQSIVFTVGGQNENLTSNCLIIVSPSTVPMLFPGISSYAGITSILQYFDYTVQSGQGVIVNSQGGDGVFLKDGATLQIFQPINPDEIPVAEQVDNNKNWIQARTYDDEGRIIGESKQFFDNQGRPTQMQTKNLTGGVVMASQKLYDKYGRSGITTLQAPIRATQYTAAVEECSTAIQQGQDLYFIYKENFITKSSSAYRYPNFDSLSITTDKKNNPDDIDNTTPGTLGWYYGPHNVIGAAVDQTKNEHRFIEPYVAQTSYPYTRSTYLEDGSNEPFATTLPGNIHKAGSGKELSYLTKSLTLSDKAMITDYLFIRGTHVFPGITNNPTNLDDKAYKISSKDIEQKEIISIQEGEGRTLITYHVATGKKVFTYYDIYGRVVCVITPNGVEKILLDKTNTTLYQNIDKITHRYNYKGKLIETNEKDFGTTKFMYRSDDLLRYSQNDKQKLTNSFAYILYDYANRPVESGLFTPSVGSTLLFNGADLKLTLEESAGNFDLSSGGTKSEVLYTVYDLPDAAAITSGDITNQTFVKSRISYTYKIETVTGNIIKTWFSYDERGRTLWTAQQIPGLGIGQAVYGIKKLTYTYAPNGKVKEVAYTGTMTNDNFYHVYYYDLDSRLSHVYTCTSSPSYNSNGDLTNGKLHARYNYYLHGPIKRVELAENLQGLDYTYTPQGWIKSLNYPNTGQDPGKDGTSASIFPEDIFAMRYDYFSNDYIKANTNIVSENYYKAPQLPYRQYYNGNIMGVTWMTKDQNGVKKPAAYGYEYDDNYQLTNAHYLSATLSAGGFLGPNFTTAKFQERNISYDANGNIQTLSRTKGDATMLHNFQYQYKTNTNQLEQVNNLLTSGVYTAYSYDEIGQLKSVTKDGNTYYVHFDNRGLLTAMSGNANGSNPIVQFYYDDRGLRYKKETYNTTTFALQSVTFYVHDMNKQTIAIYDNNNPTTTLKKTEVPVYGVDRIGMVNFDGSSPQYQYELKDHLGNVRSVLHPVYATKAPLHFTSSFEGADYTAYGNNYASQKVTIPAGINESGYGTNCIQLQYPSNSTSIAYRTQVYPGDRLTTASINAYLGTDGLKVGRLVANLLTADGKQLYFDSNRLFLAKDSSNEEGSLNIWTGLAIHNGLTVPGILYDDRGNIAAPDNIYLNVYVNHNVVETANAIIYYDRLELDITYASRADKNSLQGIIAYADYYPYGTTLENKYVSGDRYRYGYQGQFAEEDQETGLHSFEQRMYDPIIGRWISVDPLRQFANPYLGMANNPINAIDKDGQWVVPVLAGLALLGEFVFLSSFGEAMNHSDRSYEAKARGDMQSYEIHKAKAAEYGPDVAMGAGGNVVFKGLIAAYPYLKAYLVYSKIAQGTISKVGPLLEGGFGIAKYYTYTIMGKSYYIAPHAFKHLAELQKNAMKLAPEYRRMIGQKFQQALHSTIDDVMKNNKTIEYDKMYYSSGNEIMFGAPRVTGELPSVKHFMAAGTGN